MGRIQAIWVALGSLTVWTAVGIVRITSGVVNVNDWSNWTVALCLSFVSSTLFGYALARTRHRCHHTVVLYSEDHPDDD